MNWIERPAILNFEYLSGSFLREKQTGALYVYQGIDTYKREQETDRSYKVITQRSQLKLRLYSDTGKWLNMPTEALVPFNEVRTIIDLDDNEKIVYIDL